MSLKILVVDDDPGIIKVVTAGLSSNGFEVVSAPDGNEGIRAAKQQYPDLIIMDIMMPDLQGGDVVRLLKSENQTKNIPIIFLSAVTANMPKGLEKSSVNVDGQYYKIIAKPFELSHLISEVKKLISIK